MKKAWIVRGLVCSAIAALAACHGPTAKPDMSPRMPVYNVVAAGLAENDVRALGNAFGVRLQRSVDQHSAVRYSSDDFLALPVVAAQVGSGRNEDGMETVGESLRLERLRTVGVLSTGHAVTLTDEALRRAELLLTKWGPITAKTTSSHTELALVDELGKPLLPEEVVQLDTHVNYALALQGVPLVGPGAKVKAVLGREGHLLHLTYAMRGLERGEEVPIISRETAVDLCNRVFADEKWEVHAEPRLVYYAPPLDIGSVKTIFPHYECAGEAIVDGQRVELRRVFVPATLDRPKVDLAVKVDGSRVAAQAEVLGGTPPYTFVWASGSMPGRVASGAQITYTVPAAATRNSKILEPLSVLVIDANGLQVAAASVVHLAAVAAALRSPGSGADNDAGAEWIGSCGGLGGSAGNAGGFVDTFTDEGWPVRFNWGNQNAWERDFIDPNQRADGIDNRYVDDVDFLFYTGHANGNGFTFCSDHADRFLDYRDNPRWGDGIDLEWLVIAACGPLQLESNGDRWWQRWGPAFEGLHLMMGYQNVSNDNTVEGSLLAEKVFDGKAVRQAWAETAIQVQPSTVDWAVMGVIGGGTLGNWNDHIWGHGSVGADIRGSNKRGYWLLHGSC